MLVKSRDVFGRFLHNGEELRIGFLECFFDLRVRYFDRGEFCAVEFLRIHTKRRITVLPYRFDNFRNRRGYVGVTCISPKDFRIGYGAAFENLYHR